MDKKIKILEVTSFSSGFCGIWFRVKQESELLANLGYEVYVFSSNIHRGSGKIEYASHFEKFGRIKIQRFKTKKHVGENSFIWNYEKEALTLKPSIIICHAYRQYYSTVALRIAKKLKIPCILITHAPFIDKKIRGIKLSIVADMYDFFIGKKIINNYSKIFAISKWEIPYLLRLGAKKEKIVYMPNGIPSEFFKVPLRHKNSSKINMLFLGRIAPIKDIKTLLLGVYPILKKNKNVFLNFVGPEEEEYGIKIRELIKKLGIGKKVIFHGPIYDLQKKIDILDKSDIFLLTSKREGMPQSLVEAMSREKIVISSDTDAGKDLITDGYNGYLFSIGDSQKLYQKLSYIIKNMDKKIMKNARISVEKFSWDILIKKIDKIIKNETRI